MLNARIHPGTWQIFFDSLSKGLRSDEKRKYAKLRLVMPEMTGTRDMAHWLPLIGITYDPKDSALYVILDGLTHRANQPDVIWASVASDGNFETFLVLCRDGSRVSIELSDHHFPHDASVYRDGSFSLSIRKSKDKVRELWNRLVFGFGETRRKPSEGHQWEPLVHGKEAASDSQQDLSPRPPRPSLHRRNSDRGVPRNTSRPDRAIRR